MKMNAAGGGTNRPVVKNITYANGGGLINKNNITYANGGGLISNNIIKVLRI